MVNQIDSEKEKTKNKREDLIQSTVESNKWNLNKLQTSNRGYRNSELRTNCPKGRHVYLFNRRTRIGADDRFSI